MIELRTLGTLGLRDRADGREFRSLLAQPKRVAVLVYLAVARPHGFHHRDTLLGLFWPETTQDRARHALNQVLYLLRRALGNGLLMTRGNEEVGIDPKQLWCDVTAFEDALGVGDNVAALECYGGDLLPGFYLSDCPEFERWLAGERARLRDAAVAAAWSVAGAAEQAGNGVEAAGWARRAADLSIDDEEGLQRLIAMLDRAGDRAGALREYETFATRLRKEYDAEPAPETRELIATIRARAEPNGNLVAPAPVATRAPDVRTAAPTDRPEVGRAPWLNGRRKAVGALALAAALVLAATMVVILRGRRAMLDPQRVLVDIFQNETGDPSLDVLGRTATERITAGLTSIDFVDVVSLATPLLSGEPTGAEPTGRLQALAHANGTGTVVWGSYYRSGDSVEFHAHVTDAGTREQVATIEPVRGSLDDHIAAVEQLRDRVMATLAMLTDPRLARWARYAGKPLTFEAYEAFVKGMDLYNTHPQQPSVIVPHFLRAAALDSTFTMPLLWAVMAYTYPYVTTVPRYGLVDSLVEELDERREQLAPFDRALLDHALARKHSDWRAALRAMERVVEIAPRSEFLQIAGQAALDLNRPRQAIELLTQADLESGWLREWWKYWEDLAIAHHMLGNHRKELEVVRHGQPHFSDPRGSGWQELRALAALGWIEELNALLATVADTLGASGIRMVTVANELRAHGYEDAARQMDERAIEWYENRSPEERGRNELRRLAIRYIGVGRLDEARVILERLLQENPDDGNAPNVLAQLGVVAAHKGDIKEALRISGLLEERRLSERDAGRPHSYDTFRRAWIAAALGEREQAMALLHQAKAQGYRQSFPLHRAPFFESLLDYPPFHEFLRPKG